MLTGILFEEKASAFPAKLRLVTWLDEIDSQFSTFELTDNGDAPIASDGTRLHSVAHRQARPNVSFAPPLHGFSAEESPLLRFQARGLASNVVQSLSR